jgi:predicted RNA-binding Zn ribbon-like protein
MSTVVTDGSARFTDVAVGDVAVPAGAPTSGACPQAVREGDRYVLAMTPVATGWREIAIREIAGSFAVMLRADPSRLRICAELGCETAFWDETRSRTRTWCDTRTCGNQVRVNRHRHDRSQRAVADQ